MSDAVRSAVHRAIRPTSRRARGRLFGALVFGVLALATWLGPLGGGAQPIWLAPPPDASERIVFSSADPIASPSLLDLEDGRQLVFALMRSTDIVMMTRSGDGALSPPTVIGAAGPAHDVQAFATSDGTIWLAIGTHGAGEVLVMKSSDDGATWTGPQPVTHMGSRDNRFAAPFETASGRIGIVFACGDHCGKDLAVVLSDDDGATWTTPVTIHSAHPWDSSVWVDDLDTVHVVFHAGHPIQGGRFYHTQSLDGGSSWEPACAIMDPPGTSGMLSAWPTTSGVPWALFSANDVPDVDGHEIYATRASASLCAWTEPRQVTQHPAIDHSPDLTVGTDGLTTALWVRQDVEPEVFHIVESRLHTLRSTHCSIPM